MKDIFGIIYCVENLVNHKKYIGRTIQPISKRKNKHLNQSKEITSIRFHNAIRKYGEDQFEWTQIDSACTEEVLD